MLRSMSMTRTCRFLTAGVLMVCLVGSHGNSALIASAPRQSGDASGTSEQSPDLASARLASTNLGAFTDGSWFAFTDESGVNRPPALDLNGIHRAFALGPSVSNASAAGQIYRGRPYPVR